MFRSIKLRQVDLLHNECKPRRGPQPSGGPDGIAHAGDAHVQPLCHRRMDGEAASERRPALSGTWTPQRRQALPPAPTGATCHGCDGRAIAPQQLLLREATAAERGAERGRALAADWPKEPRPCASCETMFSALSTMLEAAVTVGVDTASLLLFDADPGSGALASLKLAEDGWVEDGVYIQPNPDQRWSNPDKLREAAQILCQAAAGDAEQRLQLLVADRSGVDPVFIGLLLRSIRSADAPTHTAGVQALALATDAATGLRTHTVRAIVGTLMEWLEPLVALVQNDNVRVQEWANEVLERLDIYSDREMRKHLHENGFAVLRCLASARQPRGSSGAWLQRAASATLVSLVLDKPQKYQAEIVRDVGLHAILNLAASSDDLAWEQTKLAVASLEDNSVPLAISGEDLARGNRCSSTTVVDDDLAVSVNGGDSGGSCLPLLMHLVHAVPIGAHPTRGIDDQYRMQRFCVGILARAAATQEMQLLLVEAGATAALISAARHWLGEYRRNEEPVEHQEVVVWQEATEAAAEVEAAVEVEDGAEQNGCVEVEEGPPLPPLPVNLEHLSAAVLATANLAATKGFAETMFAQLDREGEGASEEGGIDGLLALLQEIMIDAHGTEAAAGLLPHATRILACLVRSENEESGYISNWVIGAIFDRGLLLPLERTIREQDSQELGPVHPDLMRHVASSLAELAKVHGAPHYSKPEYGDDGPAVPLLARGNSGTPLLARGSSSGLSGLSRGNSGLSDFEDGPGGSMSSLTQSWNNFSGMLTGSARSLLLAAGSGSSFRADEARHFSSICADEPAAMLPRIVQECHRFEVSAGWITRLARNADPQVQNSAASVYSSISGTAQAWLVADDDDNKLDDLAKVLLTLAISESASTRKSAKMSIVALAKFSDEYRAALVAHAAILKPVLLLLTKGNTGLKQEEAADLIAEKRLAASILRYIIGSSPCREKVMRGPLADAVASVLRIYDDVEISTQMSFVFADISRDPETKQKLDSEFIGALQHMMKDDDVQSQTMQMNAVAAVSHIASEPQLQNLLHSMGIIPILVRLASSQWEDVRADAIQALTTLTEDGGPLAAATVANATVANAAIGGLSRQNSDGSGSVDLGLEAGVPVIKDSQLECMWNSTCRLGAGAYGEVFQGKWRGSDVAIKCMYAKRGGINDDPKTVERERNREFLNEVHLLMQARHPNIVLLMGTMVSSQRLCIVSELCHRGSLYKILHQRSRTSGSLQQLPPWIRRLQMVQDAASGCQFLHSNEPCIVHLDIKSPNFLVDKNWNVKVADFGLAQLKQHFFAVGTGMVGTAEWMAPEVLKGEPFNESADVYSFGVVMWEMATRCKPFYGMLPHQVMAKVGFNSQQLVPPTAEQLQAAGGGALPEGYVDVMYGCMSIQPQDRPGMDVVRSSLEQMSRVVMANENAARRAGREGERQPPPAPAARVADTTAQQSREEQRPPAQPQPAAAAEGDTDERLKG